METKNKLFFNVNLEYQSRPEDEDQDDDGKFSWLDHEKKVGDSVKNYSIRVKVVSDIMNEKFDLIVEVPEVTNLVVENLDIELRFLIGNYSFSYPAPCVEFSYKKNESEKVSDAFGGSMDKQIFEDIFSGKEMDFMYRDHRCRGKSKSAQAEREEFSLSNYESSCDVNLTVSFTSNDKKTVMEKFLNFASLVPPKEPFDFEISCEQESFNFQRSYLSKISSICSNSNGSSLKITDFKKETIKVFQDMLYQDKIENFEEKLDLEVLKFGSRYEIDALCRATRAIIIKSLTKENVIDAIEVADFLSDTELFKAALAFSKNNLGKFNESPRWGKFVNENSECALKMLSGLILKRDPLLEKAHNANSKRLKMM